MGEPVKGKDQWAKQDGFKVEKRKRSSSGYQEEHHSWGEKEDKQGEFAPESQDIDHREDPVYLFFCSKDSLGHSRLLCLLCKHVCVRARVCVCV